MQGKQEPEFKGACPASLTNDSLHCQLWFKKRSAACRSCKTVRWHVGPLPRITLRPKESRAERSSNTAEHGEHCPSKPASLHFLITIKAQGAQMIYTCSKHDRSVLKSSNHTLHCKGLRVGFQVSIPPACCERKLEPSTAASARLGLLLSWSCHAFGPAHDNGCKQVIRSPSTTTRHQQAVN